MPSDRTIVVGAAVSVLALTVLYFAWPAQAKPPGVGAEFVPQEVHDAEVVEEAEEDQEEEQEDEEEEAGGAVEPPVAVHVDVDELKRRFEEATSTAAGLFKEHRYMDAITYYTRALDLCDDIPGFENRRAPLYNNRAAMYEKAGANEDCLRECALCLLLDPLHSLARIRRARVYEATDRLEQALSELYAHMLIERDLWMEKMQTGRQIAPPDPPVRLESIMQTLGERDSAAVLAQKATEPPTDPHPLPAKNSIYDVLHSFASHGVLEERFKNHSEASVSEQLENAEGAAKVECLMDRAMVRVVKKDYEGALEDIEQAYELMEEFGETVSKKLQAEILAWRGTFFHLRQDLDRALEMYERSCELDGTVSDVWVKRAGVALDREDPDTATELFEAAMNVDVKNSSTYMYRAQLHQGKGNIEAAFEDLTTALAINPAHSVAATRLAVMYIATEKLDEANEVLNEALRHAPNAAELLLAKAELTVAEAYISGDPAKLTESMTYIDRAVANDPRNTVLLLNKADHLVRIRSGEAAAVREIQAILEGALRIKPDDVSVMTRLAQIKINLASTEEQCMEAVRLFDRVIELTKDAAEIKDLCCIREAAKGKMRGQRLLLEEGYVAMEFND